MTKLETLWFFILMVAVSFCSFSVGAIKKEQDMQIQAVDHNFAHWIKDSNGKYEFKWNVSDKVIYFQN